MNMRHEDTAGYFFEDGEHHHHPHPHPHPHPHQNCDGNLLDSDGKVLCIRPISGISGDMMLAGLACMAGVGTNELLVLAAQVGLPALEGSVTIERVAVNAVNGWSCRVVLPHEHAHRTLADIVQLIAQSKLSENARRMAERTFVLLAEAEARVHEVPVDKVTFHEVGALDSILDICLAAALFDKLKPTVLVCGPLPLCDGEIRCSHGILPVPAPAVLELLQGIPVRGIATEGETVTPTGIALLKGLGTQFGPWPAMMIDRQALVFGTRILPGVANGAIFAFGEARG